MSLGSVILCGLAGERRALIDKLVQEFPDVFAFPRLTTTRPPDEQRTHELSVKEAVLARRHHATTLAHAAKEVMGGAGGVRSLTPNGMARAADEADTSDEEGAAAAEATEVDVAGGDPLRPVPDSLGDADFDAAVASGAILVHQPDLFMHQMVTRRTGVSTEAIREVRCVRFASERGMHVICVLRCCDIHERAAMCLNKLRARCSARCCTLFRLSRAASCR